MKSRILRRGPPAFYGLKIKDRNNLTFNQNLLNSKIIPEFIKFPTLLKSRAASKTPPLTQLSSNASLLPTSDRPGFIKANRASHGNRQQIGSRRAADAKT